MQLMASQGINNLFQTKYMDRILIAALPSLLAITFGQNAEMKLEHLNEGRRMVVNSPFTTPQSEQTNRDGRHSTPIPMRFIPVGIREIANSPE